MLQSRATLRDRLPLSKTVRLTALLFVVGLAPPLASGQDVGSTWKSDLSYLGVSVWEDAKALVRAPLEIGTIRDVTPEQVLIGALVAGGIGGTIALDSTVRGEARDIDDESALTLQQAGLGILAGGLVALYGTGVWTENEAWRHAALSGVESTVVSWGLANLAKLTFGRQRPDAQKGPEAWFEGGTSFVSGDTTPAFAMAEAVAAAFDHTWWSTLPAYVAAAAVGVGRMGRDRHWASDIVASALLGIGTTKLVNYVRRQREKAGSLVTLTPMMAAGEIGLRLSVRY